MPLTVRVPSALNDSAVVLTSGVMEFQELLWREDDFVESYAYVTISGLTTSDTIDTIGIALKPGATPSCNLVGFEDIPSYGDTLTLDGITYLFTTALSGVNQVLISDTLLGNARNLFCTITASGLSGTDFYAGQTEHPTLTASYADNPLIVKTKSRGTSGNFLKASKSSAAFNIGATYFYGGTAAGSKYTLTGEVDYYGNGHYDILNVPYTSGGNFLEGYIYFNGPRGEMVNISGEVAHYAISGIFNGQSDIPEFVEVANLSGVMDSTGLMQLYWDDMHKTRGTQTLHIARPYESGTQTQHTITLTDVQFAQDIYYYIFVCLSEQEEYPECEWPRSVDARGIWYYVGRTLNPFYSLTLPKNMYLNIWVGFGNKRTLSTTRTPIGHYSSLIS